MGRGARLSHAALRTPSDWVGRGLQVGGLATSWADPWPRMSKTSLDEGLCDVTCEHPTTGPSLATVLKGKPLASVPHVRCRGQTSLLSGRRAARVWPAAAWLVCGCTAPGSEGGGGWCRSWSELGAPGARGAGVTAQLRGSCSFHCREEADLVGWTDILFRKLNYLLRPWASGGRSRAGRPMGAGGPSQLPPGLALRRPPLLALSRVGSAEAAPICWLLVQRRRLFLLPTKHWPAYQSG